MSENAIFSLFLDCVIEAVLVSRGAALIYVRDVLPFIILIN